MAKIAYGVLQHLPRTRLLVRKTYWYLQRKRFEQQFQNVEVDARIVLFESFHGRQYADSPKAIYLQMLQDNRFKDFVFIWSYREGAAFQANLETMPRTVCVKWGTQEHFQALATAKYLVLNVRLPEYVYPKMNQVYIQCWHGTPLKRLGADVSIETNNVLNTASELAWRFQLDSNKWTYMLSASPFVSQHLADAFSLPQGRRAKTVLEIGDPGNDPLFFARIDSNAQCKARESLGIPQDKKVLFYAPTWRDDSFEAGVGYTLENLIDFAALYESLGNDWVVLFRAHYHIANTFDFSSLKGFVIDASQIADINDCFIASDALVTDYSSVMFDYINTGRPILLYVPDLKHYMGDIRDFYFDIHEVPGPLCTSTAELIDAVGKLSDYERVFGERYQLFYECFCPLDDGNASKRLLDILCLQHGE